MGALLDVADGMLTAPGRCPSANSAGERTSTKAPPLSTIWWAAMVFLLLPNKPNMVATPLFRLVACPINDGARNPPSATAMTTDGESAPQSSLRNAIGDETPPDATEHARGNEC